MIVSRRRMLSLLSVLSLSTVLSIAHAGDLPQVTLKTSMGDIVLELDREKAPVTVGNFLQYVRDGHYNGTIFHRVIPGFMIQGGGFDRNMQEKKTRAPIRNEANNGLRNDIYTVAMARRGDPHSATAQFFINTQNNSSLNYPGSDGWGYTVFGKVVQGTDVVERIKNVSTGNLGPHRDVPTSPVLIESATITHGSAQ